jgi:putative oxidoreductase
MITKHLNHQYGPLIIRLFVGIIMLVQHGLPKLIDYNSKKNVFPDPLGISSELSLALVVFAEVICSVFIILGLKTRLSSIPLLITMAIAAFIVHAGDPWSKQELPVTCYASLIFTGGGAFTLKD